MRTGASAAAAPSAVRAPVSPSAEAAPPLRGTPAQALGPDQRSPHAPRDGHARLPPGWGGGGHTDRRSHSLEEPMGPRRATLSTGACLRLTRYTSAEDFHACAHERRGSVFPRLPALVLSDAHLKTSGTGPFSPLPARTVRPWDVSPGRGRPCNFPGAAAQAWGSWEGFQLRTRFPYRKRAARVPSPWTDGSPSEAQAREAPRTGRCSSCPLRCLSSDPQAFAPTFQRFFLLTNLWQSSGPKLSCEFSTSFHIEVFNPLEMGCACP